MKLRKISLWIPRRVVDILCFLLVIVFLPTVYIFEMAVVLPAFHEQGSFWYIFTFLVAIFILFNIKGNMIACIAVETSVDFNILKPPANATDLGWRYCVSKKCQKLAPPRSWHCSVCDVCILKRDHHCLFTGCCIGHRNHRYFIMFVFYMFVGSIYAFVYNSLFLWVLHAKKFWNILSLLKILCPAFNLAVGSIWHEQNLYLIYYSLNIFAVVYSSLLLVYHSQTILQGGVCYERDKGYPFKMNWKENLRSVLGNRMDLAWLSPFVVSELPDNGIDWKHETIKQK